MNSADRQELAVLEARGGFHPLETSLTLTELAVLGDHLAVAAVALTGIGAIAVHAAALPFARVAVTFIHVCVGRRGKIIEGKKQRSGESYPTIQSVPISLYLPLSVAYRCSWSAARRA